jgi:hypothetical protein
MVRRGQTRTSSGSELEDDANPQLAQLFEAVRELQEQNVEQQKQNDEHQRLQAEALDWEAELKQQLEEVRARAQVKEEACKRRAARRYDSKVRRRSLKQGDLVLRKKPGG